MSGEFDLDALQTEANQEPFGFWFGGERYELPPRMDVLAVAALSDGDLAAGLRRMLGGEQWERMKESPATLDDRKLTALFERYAKHLGTSVGELSASTGSSKPKGRR